MALLPSNTTIAPMCLGPGCGAISASQLFPISTTTGTATQFQFQQQKQQQQPVVFPPLPGASLVQQQQQLQQQQVVDEEEEERRRERSIPVLSIESQLLASMLLHQREQQVRQSSANQAAIALSLSQPPLRPRVPSVPSFPALRGPSDCSALLALYKLPPSSPTPPPPPPPPPACAPMSPASSPETLTCASSESCSLTTSSESATEQAHPQRPKRGCKRLRDPALAAAAAGTGPPLPRLARDAGTGLVPYGTLNGILVPYVFPHDSENTLTAEFEYFLSKYMGMIDTAQNELMKMRFSNRDDAEEALYFTLAHFAPCLCLVMYGTLHNKAGVYYRYLCPTATKRHGISDSPISFPESLSAAAAAASAPCDQSISEAASEVNVLRRKCSYVLENPDALHHAFMSRTQNECHWTATLAACPDNPAQLHFTRIDSISRHCALCIARRNYRTKRVIMKRMGELCADDPARLSLCPQPAAQPAQASLPEPGIVPSLSKEAETLVLFQQLYERTAAVAAAAASMAATAERRLLNPPRRPYQSQDSEFMYEFLVKHTNCKEFASSYPDLCMQLSSSMLCACEHLFLAWKKDSTMAVRCLLRKKPLVGAPGNPALRRLGIGMCVTATAYQIVLFRCFADVVFVDSHPVVIAGERLFMVTVCVIANDGQQKLACSALLESEDPVAFAGLFRWLKSESQPFVRQPFCIVADQACRAHQGFATVFRRVSHIACATHLALPDAAQCGLTRDDMGAMFLCESRSLLHDSVKRLAVAERRAPSAAQAEAVRSLAALLRKQSLVAQTSFTGNNVTCSIAEKVRTALLDALRTTCPDGAYTMKAYQCLVRDYVMVSAHQTLACAPSPPQQQQTGPDTDALLDADALAGVHPAILRLFVDTIVRQGRAVAHAPGFSSGPGTPGAAVATTVSRRGRRRTHAPHEGAEGVRSFAVKTSAAADQAVVRWCASRRRFHCSCTFSLRTGLPCVHVVVIACNLGLRIPLSAFSPRFLADDSIPGLVATRSLLLASVCPPPGSPS